MTSDVKFLITVILTVINVTALGGLLYLLFDRYTSLRAAYRLLRCLRKAAPETYRHLMQPPPFQWMFDPQRLEEFLLSSDLDVEKHDGISRYKEDCRCWIAHYKSLPSYLLRIGSIALASGAVLIILPILLGILLRIFYPSIFT